jgi:hypothetical protein
MPDSLETTVQNAWKSIWDQSTPYFAPHVIREGLRSGLVWIRPLDPLPLPDTGNVVLFNRQPWGGVSINSKNSELSQLYMVVNEGLEFNAQSGAVQAKIRFTQLRYSGDYVVQRGLATGSALKLAGVSLKGLQPAAMAAPEATAGAVSVGDDANVTLAKSYQSELLQSENGRYMVGTYYDHNEAYCQAFTNPTFLRHWQGDQTPPGTGKRTADFAADTANAAQTQNRGTVSVNGQPDPNTGYSDFNSHALSMQTLLLGACNAQKNYAAANAASNQGFGAYAWPISYKALTVNSAIAAANNGQHPSANTSSTLAAQSFAAPPQPPEPQWMKDVREKALPIIAEMEQEEEDIRRGVKLRETTGLPIHGGFRSYLATGALTVTGTARQNTNGELVVEFTRLSGDSPDVNLTLGAFPGQLFPEVEAALAKLNFLKALLGKRIVNALGSPTFLNLLGKLVTIAATGRSATRVR